MSKLMCLNPTCWDRSIDLQIGIAMLTPSMFVAGKYDSGTLSKLLRFEISLWIIQCIYGITLVRDIIVEHSMYVWLVLYFFTTEVLRI